MKKIAALSLIAVAFIATEAYAYRAAKTAVSTSSRVGRAAKGAPATSTATSAGRVNQVNSAAGLQGGAAAAATAAKAGQGSLFMTQTQMAEAALGASCDASALNSAEKGILAEAIAMNLANEDDPCLSKSSAIAKSRVISMHNIGVNTLKKLGLNDVTKATKKQKEQIKEAYAEELARVGGYTIEVARMRIAALLEGFEENNFKPCYLDAALRTH